MVAGTCGSVETGVGKFNLKHPGFNFLVLERKARSASQRSGEARRAWSGRTKKFREEGHPGWVTFHATFSNVMATPLISFLRDSCTWLGV